MRITDALLGEHAVFYAQLDHLEGELADDVPLEAVRRHAGMLAAALEGHARLEDELLLDAASEEAGGREEGPLAVMRREHREIEELLDDARSVPDAARARDLLLEAVHTARDHFLKEEHAAFPRAVSLLGSEALERLGARWAEERGVHLERGRSAGRAGPEAGAPDRR